MSGKKKRMGWERWDEPSVEIPAENEKTIGEKNASARNWLSVNADENERGEREKARERRVVENLQDRRRIRSHKLIQHNLAILI